jgi:hypothetical protein
VVLELGHDVKEEVVVGDEGVEDDEERGRGGIDDSRPGKLDITRSRPREKGIKRLN